MANTEYRRRNTLLLGCLLSMHLVAGCGDATSPTPQATLQILPATLNLLVGTSGQLNAAVTNSTNQTVNWTTSNAAVATVTNAGFVSAVGPGTATVTGTLAANSSVKQDVTVTVTQAVVQLVIDSLLDKDTGRKLVADSARGTVFAHLTINNQQANSRLEVRVDTRAFELCQTIPSGLSILSAGTQQLQLICTINTAQLDTAAATRGRPLFLNGAHTLAARLVAPGGAVAANTTKPLIFANRDVLTLTTNAVGPDSMNRGVDFKATVSAIVFSTDTANRAVKAVLSTVTLPGWVAVAFNETTAIPLPATFTINSAASQGAESIFRFTASVFDASGNDRTSRFEQSGFATFWPIDVTPPRVTVVDAPQATSPLTYDAVVLKYSTGSYNPGDTIPLFRITNGQDSAAHATTCAYRHLHGSISIRRRANATVDGPYTDPVSSGDECGHGPIVTVTDTIATFYLSGSFIDNWLGSATVALYRAVGACDQGAIVDDVAVAQGTGLGQSPTPTLSLPVIINTFSTSLRLRVGPTMAGQTFCTRLEVRDRTFNAAGQPAPNITTRVFSTTITAN